MIDSDKKSEGGCLCGEIRFEVSGPSIWGTLCYCHSCCRSAGAPAVAWSCFPQSRFRITRGNPSRYESTPGVFRAFCGDCGTSISYERRPTGEGQDLNARPEEVYVTTLSFDDPTLYPPEEHVRYVERVAWFDSSGQLPHHAEFSEAHGFRQHQKRSVE